jgi:hypothetical protein
MNTIKRLARSYYRLYRFLFLFFLVIALQLSFPGLLSAVNTQSGNIFSAAAAGDPVIAAAGDIACDPATSAFNNGLGTSSSCRQKYTSDLLVSMAPSALLDLGDNQYYCGSDQAFLTSYDLSWGRLKSITHPSVGNHEYLTSGGTGCTSANAGAAGYFQYFGAAAGTAGQGYYSFDIGTWHIIALNSNCGNVGGCGSTSAQYKWLQSDLAAHPNQCTLAYWHIPLFSSGGRANAQSLPFWNLLYASHADIVLNGHDHIYERFAPQTPTGALDPVNGITEFIVGTGGADHTSIATVAANSVVRNASTYGVIKLTLHASSIDWQFVPEAGKTFTDSGTQVCHSSASTTATPTATLISTGTTTPTPTASDTATISSTPADTLTATDSLTPTSTSVQTGTDTPTSTDTLTPTDSPTATQTTLDTATATQTAVNTPTDTPTATFTPTPTQTPVNSPTPTATIGSSSVTFIPVADTYVNAGSTTTNYGGSTTMRLDSSPDNHAYLRFGLSGLAGTTITRVLLRVYANNTDSSGIRVWAVSDITWGELTMNYTNAPALGVQLASSGAFSAVGWVSMDVTSYFTGDGTYSIGITNLSSTAISVESRESGVNAPQLVVTYSGALSPTFTPTSAATPTSSVTSTPTVTASVTGSLTATSTPAATNTSMPTATPGATNTPTSTFTQTPIPTATPTTGTVNTPTPTFTLVSTPSATATPAVSSVTFIPVADNYVDASSTSTNHGASTTLRLDGSPDVHAYIRFTVSGFSGTITQVRLLLFANNNDSSGIAAWAVSDNSWGELTMNYTNAPTLGSKLTSIGSFAAGWVTLDVTSYITGNGTYSIGVTNLSSTAISVDSRESGANGPQLVITYH